MEQLFFYLMGTGILAICLLAATTLKRLNNSLKQNNFQEANTLNSVPRLKTSIGWGNITLILISGIVGLGLVNLYMRTHAKKTLASVSETAKAAVAEETPKPVANTLDLATATVLTDEPSLKVGAETFKNLCAACHGQAGEGNIGPNFTDNFWLHGGEFKDLCKVIVEGVPEKGMISWAGQLSSDQIKQVASYILSLEGSTPPNQKAAQGTKFERKEAINFAIRPTATAAVNIPKIGQKGDKKQGQKLFDGMLGCSHCHGTGAIGHVDNRNLRALKKRYAGDASKVYDTVMEIGRMGTAMPPWGHLSMVQKQDIKTFIFSIQE